MTQEHPDAKIDRSGENVPTQKKEARRGDHRNSFPRGRGRNKGWVGPMIDYKEVELIRRFMTTSHKIMSRKRAGTSAQEQRDLKIAVKRARYLGLIPYAGP